MIPFQKGMSLSAEGGARTGYLSEAASDSLDQLQKLHVEWISVMPFAFLSGEQGNPEIYFAHRVMQNDKPDLHILGHWTYPANTSKTMYVISNTRTVELLLNGKSLGKNSSTKM